jgi:tetratricopeptide (TPR) repeat protein
MNAAHGRGLCLLHSRRPDDAIEAFQRALDLYPNHAPSNIGLALALRAAGSPHMADAVFEKVREALAILTKSRPVEAAIVRAEMATALGQGDEALATLERLLTSAPPGFAAWTIPAEPLLRQLAATKRFAGILGRLAERAR